MKNSTALISLIVLAILAAFTAFNSGSVSGNTARARLAPGPYRLGATLPLTGPAATYGKLIQDGVELALDDLRAQGRQIEMFYEDTPAPGAAAVGAARTLVEQREIDLLVANFFNPVMVAMGPVLKQHGIPSFHTAAPDDRVQASSPYVFATTTGIKAEAQLMAEYADQELHAKTAAIVYVGTTFGEHYNLHFARRFRELGGEVVHEELSPLDTTDYRSIAAVAKSKKPDVIIAGSFGAALGLFLRALGELHVTTPVIATYETEDPSVLAQAGAIADDQVTYFLPEPRRLTAGQADFRARFTSRFGYAPRLLAANSYDATILAAKALSECNANRRCVVEQLSGIKNFEGVSGIFSMEPERYARKEFITKTIRGGEFVEAMR